MTEIKLPPFNAEPVANFERPDLYSELAEALGCDPMDSHQGRLNRAARAKAALAAPPTGEVKTEAVGCTIRLKFDPVSQEWLDAPAPEVKPAPALSDDATSCERMRPGSFRCMCFECALSRGEA